MTFSGDMKICLGQVPDIGRGVFASRDINNGEIIEVCPVIVVPRDQLTFLDQTSLHAHYFHYWGPDSRDGAMVFGYGFFYNHSYTPNAKFKYNYRDKTTTFICIEDIRKGEEIRHNYNGDPKDQSPQPFRMIESRGHPTNRNPEKRTNVSKGRVLFNQIVDGVNLIRSGIVKRGLRGATKFIWQYFKINGNRNIF